MAAMNLLSLFWLSFFISYHCIFFPAYQLDNHYVLFGLNFTISSKLPIIFVNNFKLVFMFPWIACPRSMCLVNSGFSKTKFAVMKTSKHGFTSLCIPGHDPPIDITIYMDVHPNPGPVLLFDTDSDLRHDSNSTFASPALASPPGSLHHLPLPCFSSTNINVGFNSFPQVNLHLGSPSSNSSGVVVLNLTVGISNVSHVSSCHISQRLVPRLSYSRTDLLNIRRYSKNHLSSSQDINFSLFKELNIFRYRGKRGGRTGSRSSQQSQQ